MHSVKYYVFMAHVHAGLCKTRSQGKCLSYLYSAACSQVCITTPLHTQPVELLPKSIQQFSQSVPSLGGQRDQNDTTLNSVYKEFEKERLSKLQAARREREKIIADLETVPQPVKSFQLRHVQTNKLQNANGEIKNPSGRHRMTSALGPSEGERVHSPRRTTCTAVLRDEVLNSYSYIEHTVGKFNKNNMCLKRDGCLKTRCSQYD